MIGQILNFSNYTIKRKIIIGIFLPMAILLVLSAVSLLSVRAITSTSARVEHTHEVVASSEQILSSAVDMETGLRGFLLAGKEEFLEPYNSGSEDVFTAIDKLQQIVSDNPRQVARLDETRRTLLQWQKINAEPAIKLRRGIGDAKTMNHMAGVIGEAKGKAFFDKFRGLIRRFVDVEKTLLGQRQTESKILAEQFSQQIITLVESGKWLTHTANVLTRSAKILARATDMETGMRGYLLSGDDDFLEPYRAGRTELYDGIENLQGLVSDNSLQVERLNKIGEIANKWDNEVAKPAIVLRRKVTTGDAAAADITNLVGRKTGMSIFDNLRKSLNAFDSIERTQLRNRQATAGAAAEKIDEILKSMDRARKWVIHTHEVISTATDILASAVDMETGMRGFLLTGKEAFLEPYSAGQKTFGKLIAELSKEVSDNPAQVTLLAEIDSIMEKWVHSVATPNIALRRSISVSLSMENMANFVSDAKGKTLFDKFRKTLSEFQNEERGLMEVRKAENARSVQRTQVVIGALAAIGLIAAWFFGRIATHEAIQRTSALAGARTNVMIADGDNKIIYLNESMESTFRESEAEIRKVFTEFSVDQLTGTNMDNFHKDPNHQRAVIQNLRSAFETEIKIGTKTFSLNASPILDGSKRLGTVVEWGDLTNKRVAEERDHRVTQEALRIRAALDVATTNMMVADSDYNIIYMNSTMMKMFRSAEADIRKQLPNFQVDRLIGTNMDEFHDDPSHQRGYMDKLSGTRHSMLQIGGRSFAHTASAIMDADGNRAGTVIEWEDRTEEMAMKIELSTLVQSVSNGDLNSRISLETEDQFMQNMGQSMNELAETVRKVIEDISATTRSLAEGDLTVQQATDYEGVYSEIAENTNAAVNRLRATIETIGVASVEVGNASKEMRAGSIDLSHRTEQQAANIEETAASMEEVAATVTQNANNSSEANKQAVEAREQANEGGEIVEKAVTAMARIEESSQKIAEIIGVIDEIAFQTNLLALNAAVEAARAGDAGKGFAVVAAEVGKLALRSSDAAKEIKELIAGSGAEVKLGVELVENTGKSLEEIVGSVGRVADLISEISIASREQADSVQEINATIAKMDEMTQQNSALVEEYSASTGALENQSHFLLDSVAFFKVGEKDTRLQNRPAPGPQPHMATPGNRSKPDSGSPFDDEAGWEEF